MQNTINIYNPLEPEGFAGPTIAQWMAGHWQGSLNKHPGPYFFLIENPDDD
jgi:hypothetical protein